MVKKIYCFLWFYLNHLQCILAKTKYSPDNNTLKLFQSTYTIFQWFFFHNQYSPKCMQICKRFSWMRYIVCKYLTSFNSVHLWLHYRSFLSNCHFVEYMYTVMAQQSNENMIVPWSFMSNGMQVEDTNQQLCSVYWYQCCYNVRWCTI